MLLNFIKKKNIKFKYLLLLEPTSPLRDYKDINFCINKMINQNIDTIVSVAKVKAQHPNFLFYVNKKRYLKTFLEK